MKNLTTQPVALEYQSILSGKHRGTKATPIVSPSRNRVVTGDNGLHSPLELGDKRTIMVVSLNVLAILTAVVSLMCTSVLSNGSKAHLNPYCVFDVFTNSCDKAFSDSIITFPYSRVNKAQHDLHEDDSDPHFREPFKNKRSRFVVPFDGIYYLHFRGYKGMDSCDTSLYINGEGELFKCPKNSNVGGLVSWSILKKLKKKDVVYLKSARYTFLNETFFTCSESKKMEFIGQLVESKEMVLSKFSREK